MMPPKETRRAEGRGRPEGEPRKSARVRTQSRVTLPANLARVNEAAKRDKSTRFTALLHHVDVSALERAFRRLKRSAAPGVDGETVASYEQSLAQNLERLHAQIHSGRYRPQPVRRAYIPKADGGRRPLGVTALEDKIVQGAVPRS
jgi:RNA-directed DNA polymerase